MQSRAGSFRSTRSARSARSARVNRSKQPDTPAAPNVSAIPPAKHASNDTLNTLHVAATDASVSDRSHLHPNMYLPEHVPKQNAVKALFGTPRGSGKRERQEQRSVTPISIAVSAASEDDEPVVMEHKAAAPEQPYDNDYAAQGIVVPNLSLLNATFNPEEDTHL